MNIIIVGGGTIGFSLAEHLSRLNHHISIIEHNKARCDYIRTNDGKGSSPDVLYNAGIESADIIIAVTPSDETNLLVCNFAMQHNVEKRIARIKSDIYTQNLKDISLERAGVTHLIEPELEVVKRILQYVELPGVIETANFQHDNIYLRGYHITEDMPLAYKTLIEINQMGKASPMLIVVIVREGKSLPPTGNQRIIPGDKIVAIMPKTSFPTFRTLLNRKATKLKRIVISGNTLTAIHLTKALKPFCEKIFLTDPDLAHGSIAASTLDGIEVFHGDTRNSDVLKELHIEHADCFIAAGMDSEDNIMSCLLAKEEGAKMVIAIREDTRYTNLFNSLGIDQIVNPQDITLNIIIEKIQKVPIGTYLKLKTADIEIIRCKVKKNSTVVDSPIRQLKLFSQKNIIIGCIIRTDTVIIPWGDTVFEKDDEVMIICDKQHTGLVNKLFNPKFTLPFKPVT